MFVYVWLYVVGTLGLMGGNLRKAEGVEGKGDTLYKGGGLKSRETWEIIHGVWLCIQN